MIAQPHGTSAPRPTRRDASRRCRPAARAACEHRRRCRPSTRIVAPFLHGAETVQIDLAPYSLTREQVAERYAAAGFSVKPRTVSLYAQQGRLRARKVEAKNGLERYLFDPASVDEDIAKRRQEADSYAAPETVYATANGAGTAHEGRCTTVHTRCLHRLCTVSSTRRRSASRFSRPSFGWSGTRGCEPSAGQSRRGTARSRLPSSSASTSSALPCSRLPRKSRHRRSQSPSPIRRRPSDDAKPRASFLRRLLVGQLDEATTVQAAGQTPPASPPGSAATRGGRGGSPPTWKTAGYVPRVVPPGRGVASERERR